MLLILVRFQNALAENLRFSGSVVRHSNARAAKSIWAK
jgi:hypothetical protein